MGKCCPKCGEPIVIELANSLLCQACYLAAVRQVPREQVVREIQALQAEVDKYVSPKA